MIWGQQFDCWDLAEPVEQGGLKVTNSDQFNLHGEVVEDEPAGERAGSLAAHEAAADDADTEGGFHEMDREGRFWGILWATSPLGGVGEFGPCCSSSWSRRPVKPSNAWRFRFKRPIN